MWRFRHLLTVQRTIGFKTGTGGSSGVGFLRRALDLTFFPELYAVRTEIGTWPGRRSHPREPGRGARAGRDTVARAPRSGAHARVAFRTCRRESPGDGPRPADGDAQCQRWPGRHGDPGPALDRLARDHLRHRGCHRAGARLRGRTG